MKWQYFLIGFFTLAIHSTCLWSQFFSTGETPASLHWSKISTPHFRIFFPDEIKDDANKLANRLEQFKLLTENDLQYTVKRFPVILHSSSVLSNGYVTLAPKRMELVSVSPQDAYAQDWISQLTLHEYRHVVQLSKLNQGFTHALSWLTGEIAPGIVSSMIPSWFYEGDAVFNETRLSASGRGRIPGFEMQLRTLLLQHPGTFSYNKAVFGSYRDFVPDQYRYGYQIVSYARSRYGHQVWPRAIDYTARHPFVIWPVAFYLKKNYGIYKSGLYKQTIDSLKDQYNNQEETITYINYASKNIRKRTDFTSYILPKDLGNGILLAMRTGMNDPGSFVIIDSSGREKRLFTTGYTKGLKCDVSGSRLVWDEINTDPRWGRRDFSTIIVFDLTKRKRHALTSKTRYFSPDFSPDGHQIAVAEADDKNRNYVSVLDAFTGERLVQLPAPQNKAIQFPEWISNSEIVAITVSDKGKQLEHVNLKKNRWTVLLPDTWFDISEPLNYKQYILFRSSFEGIENIYAVDKNNSALLYQVTFSRFGAYHPSISADSTRLIFSNYTQSGFDVASIPLDTLTWGKSITPPPLAGHITIAPGKSDISDIGDSLFRVDYQPEPYHKISNLVNFHSWAPFYTQLEDFTGPVREIPINLGIMVFSQNLLSTAISSIGYRYYQGNHEFIPRIIWRGWYPVVEFSGQFGGSGNQIHLKSYVPLAFTKGKYITQLQPQAEYEYSPTWYEVGDELRRGIDYLHYKLFLNHYLRLSSRDLYPRWGQNLAVTFTQTPVDKALFGNLLSFQAVAYFPGIFPHHHFFIMAGAQRQRQEKYFLPINRIVFPRGYNTAVSRQFTSIQVNYSFPAGYPDLSLGPLLYLKRFRVNLFHDWSYGVDIFETHDSGRANYTGNYRSYGTEILADLHIIRIIFPVSAGVRLGYSPGKKEFFTELMLSVQTGVF